MLTNLSIRRGVLATAAAAAGALALTIGLVQMPQAATSPAIPEGPGSVSGAPQLPKGFTDTFTSQYVEANGMRLHAVIGGKGPALLLVHGWPQSWYQWRPVMPALARAVADEEIANNANKATHNFLAMCIISSSL